MSGICVMAGYRSAVTNSSIDYIKTRFTFHQRTSARPRVNNTAATPMEPYLVAAIIQDSMAHPHQSVQLPTTAAETVMRYHSISHRTPVCMSAKFSAWRARSHGRPGRTAPSQICSLLPTDAKNTDIERQRTAIVCPNHLGLLLLISRVPCS